MESSKQHADCEDRNVQNSNDGRHEEETTDVNEDELVVETGADGKWIEPDIEEWNSLLDFLEINKDPMDIQLSDFDNKRLVSVEQAESFYMLYAKLVGFSVRKKLKRKDKNNDIVVRSWVCSCEGKREPKYCNTENRIREVRPVTRLMCAAEFRINIDKVNKNWIVKCFNTSHTHKLAVSSEKIFLRSHRKIDDPTKEQAFSMKRAGINTFQCYNYFVEVNGNWKDLGFLKKDLYRAIAKDNSNLDDTDTNRAMCLLESKKGADDKFFYKYEVDEDRRLRNLFWSDGSCQIDYKLFGDCLSFDATYKTNRYGKPLVILLGSNNHDKTCVFGSALLQDETAENYVWLLETFLGCMDGKMPKTVLTDGCRSMSKALEAIMPGIPRRICSWHILKNAVAHIKASGFNTDFRKFIFRYYEEAEWEIKWNGMVKEYNLEANAWIEAHYATRKQWADTFLRGHYFGGAKATGRCESMNSLLKKDLDNKVSLWKFFKHFEFSLSMLHFNEMEEHYRTNMTETLPNQTSMPSVEDDVSSIFTREIYKRIKREMQRSEKYVTIIDREENQAVCNVKPFGGKVAKRTVTISDDRATIQCDCYSFETKGIPCRHIFASMKSLEILNFPDCLVNRRWLKDAKHFDYLTNHEERKYPHPESARNLRYGSLSKNCGITSYLASKSDKSFQRAMQVVSALNVELSKYPAEDETQHRQNAEGTFHDPVLDSTVSKPRGRPTVATTLKSKQVASSSKPQNKGQTKRKRNTPNHCKTCGRTGHDSRNCHKFKDDDLEENSDSNID